MRKNKNIIIPEEKSDHFNRKNLFSAVNVRIVFSGLGKVSSIVGYVLGFSKSLPALLFNTGGFILSGITSTLQRKAFADEIKNINFMIQEKEHDIQAIEDNNHQLAKFKAITPNVTDNWLETCGTGRTCFEGKSSTAFMISTLCQATATTCNAIMIAQNDLSKDTESTLQTTAIITGVAAMAIFYGTQHFYNKNQSRILETAHKRLGATIAIEKIQQQYAHERLQQQNVQQSAPATNDEIDADNFEEKVAFLSSR